VRDADRNIVASVAFAAGGGAYVALVSAHDVFGWLVIALGAVGVILNVILRARTHGR
jgi:hypothetical protein